MTKVVGVRFSDTGKMYYFDPKVFDIKNGQEIIVETANGLEFGKASTGVKLVEDDEVVSPLKPVIRIATDEDRKKVEENKRKEKEAFEICNQKIQKHNLEMNLTNAEYSFDCSKVIFYFTADGRIDFRELVKDLASTLHTRIELRQIGVRDESKMLGGLGICGRPFCCSTFLDGFHSVTIKMAKDQGLSLAPGKISGTCGRLMCCLKYEQNSYDYLHKITPKVGTVVDCRHGRGTVVDSAILTGKLKIQLDNTPDGLPVIVNREEVRIVRDNKQKVNKI
ncbi:MAG TPA: stage 0 sporulation family protein [Oscillospiraceae bacterium]|nr:stage 0 sporulation family protein [Oscillospiraceae bacterium]